MERGHAELSCLLPDVGQLGARPGGSPRVMERGEGGGGVRAMRGIQGIVGVVLVGWIEGIVGGVATGQIEDIGITIAPLRKAWLSSSPHV